MSIVKITGHASGTGTLTVTAPDTSTNRTLTLPDATGTLATTADTTDLDGAVVINESGADVDFRVESDGEANMLVVDGGNNAVGIGSATPDSGRKLHIEGGGTGIGITFKDTAGSQWGFINDANLFKLRRDSSSADHIIVDANGIVTMPLQPVATSAWTGNVGTEAIPADNIAVNVGSHLAASGRFTAPVAGVYWYAWTGMTATSSNNLKVEIHKNGSGLGNLYASYSKNGEYSRGQMFGYVTLAANDYLQFHNTATEAIHTQYGTINFALVS